VQSTMNGMWFHRPFLEIQILWVVQEHEMKTEQ
jgi:hypothetical protein